MKIAIRKIEDDYPYRLLLQADETQESIDKYLFDSDVYVAEVPSKKEQVGVFCLFRVDTATVELKNIAVDEPYRGMGIGSRLIAEVAAIAATEGYREIIVGTGTEDCAAAQIRFYEKNGFHKYDVRKNFFIDNFPCPIYENGVQLKDMLILRRTIKFPTIFIFFASYLMAMNDKDSLHGKPSFGDYGEETLPAKAILLNEGEVAKNIYRVESGCLRLFFVHKGKEITFQFFFEGDMVASFESIYNDRPSMFSLQAIEPSTVRVIGRDEFRKALDDTGVRDGFEQRLAQRFIAYQKLFLSRIKNSPQERYEELLRERPDIIKRIPQHYIASYLGITPVSLSRIRNRR